MRKIICGLAAGVLAGFLVDGTCKREEPVETQDRKMTREMMVYLEENGDSFGPVHQPFRDVPFIEKVEWTEALAFSRRADTKYGGCIISTSIGGAFHIGYVEFLSGFTDEDHNGCPDILNVGVYGDPIFIYDKQIEDSQQPYRFILKGVYRGLLREAHRQLISDHLD